LYSTGTFLLVKGFMKFNIVCLLYDPFLNKQINKKKHE
jgi:hypothetical protein